MTDKMFETEADATVESVAGLISGDSIVAPVFTDMHLYDLSSECLAKLYDGLSLVCGGLEKRGITPDGVISLGDNPAMLGREKHSSNETIFGLFSGVYDKLSEASDVPFYILNGNHDGIGTDFFDPELWYDAVGQGYDKGKTVRDGRSAYFYVDAARSKTRMIFLSIPHGCDVEAEYPTPLWSFGDRQLGWLASEALKTSDGWGCVLLCHVPIYYDYTGDQSSMLGVWNGKAAVETHISALCGWIDDRDILLGIIEAYRARGKFESAGHGVAADFSGYESTRLAACVSGHMHDDEIYAPNEKIAGQRDTRNLLPCPQIVVGSANPAINPQLAKSIRFGVSFDVMVYTPSRGKLDFIRFGDGEDRSSGV